jgi:hypothetical protein
MMLASRELKWDEVEVCCFNAFVDHRISGDLSFLA